MELHGLSQDALWKAMRDELEEGGIVILGRYRAGAVDGHIAQARLIVARKLV